MTKIPKSYSKIYNKIPIRGSAKQGDSNSFKIVQADLLLKKTGQYRRWLELRHKNDNTAEKVSELVLQRHRLIEDAASGKKVDRFLFDGLTLKLELHKIFLFITDELEKHGFKWTENIEGKPVSDKLFLKNINKSPKEKEAGEELILEVKYKNRLLSNGILAYKENENLYYPLKGVSGLLDVEMEKDSFGIYKGRSHDEMDIVLDLNKNIVKKDSGFLKINEKDILKKDGDLYLSRLFKNER